MLLPLLWLLWCAEEALLAARDGLVGEIQQLPPMYSAIKVRCLAVVACKCAFHCSCALSWQPLACHVNDGGKRGKHLALLSRTDTHLLCSFFSVPHCTMLF